MISIPRVRKGKPYECAWCKKEFVRHTPGKFCSNSCQGRHKTARLTEEWLNGEQPGYYGKNMQVAGFVRLYLADTRGPCCEQCGWDKTHPDDSRFLVQVDHIDGDASNCHPGNLRLLCPNCHAMTPNFGARNKKSSRVR